MGTNKSRRAHTCAVWIILSRLASEQKVSWKRYWKKMSYAPLPFLNSHLLMSFESASPNKLKGVQMWQEVHKKARKKTKEQIGRQQLTRVLKWKASIVAAGKKDAVHLGRVVVLVPELGTKLGLPGKPNLTHKSTDVTNWVRMCTFEKQKCTQNHLWKIC